MLSSQACCVVNSYWVTTLAVACEWRTFDIELRAFRNSIILQIIANLPKEYQVLYKKPQRILCLWIRYVRRLMKSISRPKVSRVVTLDGTRSIGDVIGRLSVSASTFSLAVNRLCTV